MNFPLNVEELEAYLPHRPPMRWIETVTSASSNVGECSLTLRTPALYWSDGRILPTAPLEWMSQSYGYYRAALYAQSLPGSAVRLERAFLAGIREGVIEDLKNLRVGQVVSVQVTTLRELGPLTLVHARVEVEGARIAEATLKLYGEAS